MFPSFRIFPMGVLPTGGMLGPVQSVIWRFCNAVRYSANLIIGIVALLEADASPKGVDTETVPQQLPWSAIQPTGLDAVDQQHKHLVDIFNGAVLAHSRGATREQAGVLLSSLSDYTHYHFREEAQLMRRYGVNADHQRVHLQAHGHLIQFLQQARAMAGRYRGPGSNGTANRLKIRLDS